MRIVGVGESINAAPRTRRGSSQAHDAEAPETQSRALIAVETTAAGERAPRVTRHPAAAFLAQLIATRMQAPQSSDAPGSRVEIELVLDARR